MNQPTLDHAINLIVSDRFALRACVLNYDTVEDDITELVELVRKTGSQLI